MNSALPHVNESFNYNKKAVIGAQTGGVRDVPESISGDDSPSALIKLMAEWNNACEMRVGPIVPAFSTWMIWFALIKDDRHKCKCVTHCWWMESQYGFWAEYKQIYSLLKKKTDQRIAVHGFNWTQIWKTKSIVKGILHVCSQDS